MVYGIDIRDKVLKKIKHEDSGILNDENLEKLLTNSNIDGDEFLKFFLYEKYKYTKKLSYENTDPDIFNEINNAYDWLDQYEANEINNFNISNTFWTMKLYLKCKIEEAREEDTIEEDTIKYNSKMDFLDYISNNYNFIHSIYEDDHYLIDFYRHGKEKFLNTSYQIGNYIPFPKGIVFNETMTFDAILNCIYKWYAVNENKNINENNELSILFDNNQLKEDMIEQLSKWLSTFKSWIDFVHTNYLEPFLDTKKKPLELVLKDRKLGYKFIFDRYMQNISACIEKRTYLISKSLQIDIPLNIRIKYSKLYAQILNLTLIKTDIKIIKSIQSLVFFILHKIIGEDVNLWKCVFYPASDLTIFTMLCYGIFLMLIFSIGKIFGLNIFVYKKPANYFLNKYFFLFICLFLSTGIAYWNKSFLETYFENRNKLKKVLTYVGNLGTVGLCIIVILKLLNKHANWLISVSQLIAILCLLITLMNLIWHDGKTHIPDTTDKTRYKPSYDAIDVITAMIGFVKCIIIYFCIYLLLMVLVYTIEHFSTVITIIVIIICLAIPLTFMKFEDK